MNILKTLLNSSKTQLVIALYKKWVIDPVQEMKCVDQPKCSRSRTGVASGHATVFYKNSSTNGQGQIPEAR
jgi:hypothetical protein